MMLKRWIKENQEWLIDGWCLITGIIDQLIKQPQLFCEFHTPLWLQATERTVLYKCTFAHLPLDWGWKGAFIYLHQSWSVEMCPCLSEATALCRHARLRNCEQHWTRLQEETSRWSGGGRPRVFLWVTTEDTPNANSVRYVFDPGQKEGLMTHTDPFGLNQVCWSEKGWKVWMKSYCNTCIHIHLGHICTILGWFTVQIQFQS